MPKISDIFTVTWHRRINQAREWQVEVVGSGCKAFQIRKFCCENNQWLSLQTQLFPIYIHTMQFVGPSGRVVLTAGLRPLACWECGFESCRGHGCLSVVSVVSCQVEVCATD